MNPTIEEIFRDESYHAIRESQNASMKPKSKGDELRELFENLDHRANMGDVWDLIEHLESELNLGMETMAKAESTIYTLIRHRGMLERTLIMLINASLKHKMDKDDLEIEDANSALDAVWKGQREAAGTADEKPDGQAENAESIHPESKP